MGSKEMRHLLCGNVACGISARAWDFYTAIGFRDFCGLMIPFVPNVCVIHVAEPLGMDCTDQVMLCWLCTPFEGIILPGWTEGNGDLEHHQG